MKAGVYKIINLKNNKFYIGSSINLVHRKCEHFRMLSLNKHHSLYLQRAYNKHGKNNFIFEVIEFVIDNLKLIKREQFYIDKYKPHYNICKLAGSSLGRRHTKKSRLKMSRLKKGKSFHTPYQIQRTKEVHTGKVIPEKIRLLYARKVYQIDYLTGKVIRKFKCITDAKNTTGANNIFAVLNGSQLKSGGYKWMYVKPSFSEIQRLNNKRNKVTKNKIKRWVEVGKTNSKPVIKIDAITNKELCKYVSAKIAAIKIGVKMSDCIKAVCRNQRITAYGFKWRYAA